MYPDDPVHERLTLMQAFTVKEFALRLALIRVMEVSQKTIDYWEGLAKNTGSVSYRMACKVIIKQHIHATGDKVDGYLMGIARFRNERRDPAGSYN